MAVFYKVLKAAPLGTPWTNPNYPDAKPLQRYWCQVEGQNWPVSVSKQVPNSVTPGEYIYGDLAHTKSQKGTEYWTFKSQKVPPGVNRPASTPAQATAQQSTGAEEYAAKWANENAGEIMPKWFTPVYNMVEYIYKEMKKMESPDLPPEPTPIPTPEPKPNPSTVKQVAGEPLPEAEQVKLDDIFGVPAEEYTEGK